MALTLGSTPNQQSTQQIQASVQMLLNQLASSMTRSVDNLINQLIPYKAISGNPLVVAARAGVLDAVVLSSSPLTQTATTTTTTTTATNTANSNPGNPQFAITIKVNRQILELTSQTPLPKNSQLRINITADNQVIILKVSEPTSDKLANTVTPPITRGAPTHTSRKSSSAPIPTDTITTKNQRTIEQGLRQTLPVQQPLKNLLPLLQQLTQQPPKDWPKPLLNNLTVLLQQFPNAKQVQQAQPLKQAINNNGGFFEAKLAQLVFKSFAKNTSAPIVDSKAPASAPLNYDIKGLLQRILPQIDKAIAGRETPGAKTSSFTPSTPSPTTQALLSDAASDKRKTQPYTYTPQSLVDPIVTTNKTTITNENTGKSHTDVLLRQLGNQLIASLARSQMHQLESLGNRQANSSDSAAPVNSWSMELPIMNGSSVDNLAIRIDQHAHQEEGTSNKEEKKIWTVMLAFDLHQLGKMNVQLKVLDNTVSATVWSEQHQTHQEVQQQIKTLSKNLKKVGVNVKTIDCQLGLPNNESQPLYTQLVDVRT